MAVILNIETSTRICSVALAINGNVISIRESSVKNAHAESITLFSEAVIKQAGLSFDKIDAIAVSKGPGSYTGLRIGVSTAKGFCYSLDKSLISIGTLDALAYGMILEMKENASNYFYCPMIDARRMEVYTTLYDAELKPIQEIRAEIIDNKSFSEILKNRRIVFGGDGADKCESILEKNNNAYFLREFQTSSYYLSKIADDKFNADQFEEVAYFEPFYLKDFVAGVPRIKGLK